MGNAFKLLVMVRRTVSPAGIAWLNVTLKFVEVGISLVVRPVFGKALTGGATSFEFGPSPYVTPDTT